MICFVMLQLCSVEMTNDLTNIHFLVPQLVGKKNFYIVYFVIFTQTNYCHYFLLIWTKLPGVSWFYFFKWPAGCWATIFFCALCIILEIVLYLVYWFVFYFVHDCIGNCTKLYSGLCIIWYCLLYQLLY